MEPLLAIALTFSTSVIIYLTNKNQRLLLAPLNRRWRLLAYSLAIIAFALWLYSVSPSAAMFIWLLSLFITLGGCPFLALIKPKRDV